MKEKLQVLPRLISNVTVLDCFDKMNGNAESAWNSYQLFPPESNNDSNAELPDPQDFTVKSSVKLGDNWGAPSFRYRKNITINSMKVAANHLDFPVLIDLYDNDLYLDVQANGNDILFTDIAGTKLDHELEYFNQTYNSTHAHIVAWVRIPNLSSTSDTIISMYYGNPYAGSQENPTGVWNSNYLAVWHFNETVIDESSGVIHYDSTLNAYHGTQDGNDDFIGKISDGQNFDGSNDKINIPLNLSLNPSTDVTISGWFKLNSAYSSSSSTSLLLLEKFTSNDQDMAIILTGTDYSQGEDGSLVFKIENGDVSYKWTETRTWLAGTWYYFACVLDSDELANNKIYINGLDDTDSTDWSNGNNANLGWNADWNIGGGNVDTGQLGNGDVWFDGIIDEVRISSISRSNTWMITEYNNQYDTKSFYSIKKEEEYFGGSTTGFRTYHGSFQFLSGIESIQDIGGTVDPSQAFMIMYYAGGSSASHPREHQVSGYISSSTQITFDRVSEDPNSYVSWWIVESPEFYVQRGSINVDAGQTSNAMSVSMVDPSRSLVIGHSRVNEPSANQQDTQDGFITVELQDATTVIAERAGTATGRDALIRFQIVEWPLEYNVYTGEVDVTSMAEATDLITGSGNPSDPVIDMSSSWVYFTYDCTDNGLQQTSIYGQITDTNEIRFGRYDSSSYANRIRWYVVEHPPGEEVNVQRGDFNWDPLNSGTNTITNDIPTQVDPDRTLIVRSSSSRGTGNSFPRQKNLPRLISGSQWTGTQYCGTTENYDQHEERWQIISLPSPDNMPPIIHDFGIDDPGNGFPQFWANISDQKSNVESVTLSLNGTYHSMTLNETGFWIYQPSLINFGDFFRYQIKNTTDTPGNYLTKESAIRNITFNYDTVSPYVFDWEYYSYMGPFGTFKANVTDTWGEIGFVLVNVTKCAGIERNNLTAIMRPTVSGYINDTLQADSGTILFEIIVNDTTGNSYTSSEHQGEVNKAPIASNLTLFPDPLHSNNTLSLSYDFYDEDGDSEVGTEISWYKNSVIEAAYNDMNQIPAYVLVKGDSWNASVQPKDGKDFGELMWSTTITVLNTAPQISNYYIAPDTPTTDSILTSIYFYYDHDNDDENITNRKIRWYKNGQLVISINDQISVLTEETTNGETWFFEICVHDGTNYSNWVTSTSVTIANTAPIASDLDLAPSNPKTYHDLLASYNFVDADGDPESGSIIRWFKNGVEQPTYKNQLIIPASATKRGENWYFIVLPSDGIDNGSLKTSLMINIANTAPSASDLSITPNEPKTGNELTVIFSYTDTDSDPESGTEILWFKDGMLQGGLNYSTTVAVTYTARGQVWHCKIRPSDGTDFGEWISVSANVTIGNTGPSAIDLTITPVSPMVVDDLTASYTYTDPDSDPESGTKIIWYKNGVLQGILNGSTTISASYTIKGQEWHYKVRLSDGTDFGEWFSLPINITIANTAPFASDLAITPSEPKTGDDLTASYSYTDPDSDLEGGSFIRWYKNGEEQTTYENQTIIPSAATNRGENWYFTIQPSDSLDYGVLKISSMVTITNTIPSVSNLIMIPNEPKTGNDLTASYTYTDPDSDLEYGTEILWYKDGILQGALNGSIIVPASYTAKGQEWYYELRPSDGTDFGQWANVQNNVTINNTPPSASDLAITPGSPVTENVLMATYYYKDNDADPESGINIIWFKEGILQEDLNDSLYVGPNHTVKGQVWHFKVQVYDGFDFSDWLSVSSNITISNMAPSVSDLAITPYTPKTGNNLMIMYFYTDPDSDPENGSIIRWYKNGVEQLSYENHTTISAAVTNKGEIWYFTIHPSDGTDYGTLKTSSSVTIANTVPTITNPVITPDEPLTSHNLIANYTYMDPDNDPESGIEILWYQDNILRKDLNNSKIVPAGYTIKDQVWHYKILPSDGSDFGNWMEVLFNVTISNTAPSASELAIIPENITTKDDLLVIYTYMDPDTDLESGTKILWYKDGVLQEVLNDSIVIPATFTSKGQEWHCTIRPSDGIDFGEWVSVPVNISIDNTAPTASGVVITPNNPNTGDILITSYIYLDPDLDLESGSCILWYKNDVEQISYVNQTIIPASATNKGETWYFTIQPSDGTDFGSLKISPIITITNTAPSISDFTIIPSGAKTGDDLTTSYTYTDADSDTERGTKILWYKDGELQGALNGSIIVSAIYTAEGEVWHCKVRPSDGTDFGFWVRVLVNVTINNTAPSVTYLNMIPMNPTTGNDLTASYTYTDPDADPESGTEILWYKDGILQAILNGSAKVAASYTTKGEEWHCKVRPSDGINFGEWISVQNNITIGNTAPSANNLVITPSTPQTEHDLIATYSYSDVDSDPEIGSFIRWYKNDVEQISYVNQTIIPSATTNRGENWYFTIQPSDGSDSGNLKTSPIITLMNTAPSATSLLITPTNPQTGEDLILSYTYTDPDMDPEIGTIILWYKDGVLQKALNNSIIIVAIYSSKGQIWHCKVQASDGTGLGDWVSVSNNITIQNTAPFVSSLLITPNEPQTNQDLIVSYMYTDVDLDPESGNEVLWYKDGVLQITLNGSMNVPASYTDEGQLWHCKIRSSDGIDFSDWIGCSKNVTIHNTPPTASDIKILESSPVSNNSDLHVTYSYLDYDGDEQENTSRRIRWYKNGTLQETLNDLLLVGNGNSTSGDIWYFTIQVSDGINLSKLGISPSVSIEVPPNSPPEAKFLNITPGNPITSNNLYINWTFFDEDGDSESGSEFYWYCNGVHMTDYDGLQTLSSTATVKGDVWHIKVRPRDGTDFGNITSIKSNITIGNTAPSIESLVINPEDPVTTSELRGNFNWSDFDTNDVESGSNIIWFKDGVIQGALNGSRTVSANYTAKGQEWHCKVQPSDGVDFGEWLGSAINVTIGNTAPSVNELSLLPIDPKTEHDLTTSYTFNDLDSDPETESYIRWYKNGEEQITYENQTIIPVSATKRGENWYFTIQPNDGINYGSLKISSMVTIANTVPSVNDLIITPDEPKTGEDLIASYTYTDADIDPESGTEFLWYKDGLLQRALNGSKNVPASYTAKGQEWHYKISPSDGTDLGLWVSVPVNITIHNTEPTASDLTITPGNPKTRQIILAFHIFTDTDSDFESGTKIIWFKDGVLQGVLNGSRAVSANYTAKGQEWHCKVQPSDGTDFGEWISSQTNVTISNTEPSVSELAITPSNPKTANDLTANYRYEDVDTDIESESNIRWFKNGEEQVVYENQTTISAANTSKGETWYFIILPSDGTDHGSMKSSSLVAIVNTAPSISDLFIIPEIPMTEDDLMISYNYADVDGDPKRTTKILWYKNGVLQGVLNGSSRVSASYTTKGQIWHCKVRPSDGTDFGDWLGSQDNVTIDNTAPVANELTLIPNNPRTTHDIIASYVYSDLDSDPESGSIIRWYKNGLEQVSYENQFILPSIATSKVENWYFTIQPFDGINYGSMKTSPSITISNTAPSVSNLSIVPRNPVTGEDLVASYNYTDVDGDLESGSYIRWLKNGEEQPTYENETTIPASATSKGENWYFTILPCDGTSFGDLKTTLMITISNTAPSISDIAIMPINPKTNHNLTISYSFTDADNDDEILAEILWYKDDVLQGALNDSATVVASYTAKGQVWRCKIRSFDGINFSEFVSSPINVTISNTAPNASNLAIFPSEPKIGDNLKISYNYDDPDKDSEGGTIIRWYKNGVEQTAYENQTTIPVSAIRKEENWSFTIQPGDSTENGFIKTSPIVTIVNTAPFVNDLSISPSNPKTSHELLSSYNYTDVDLDPESGSIIRWFKNGIEQVTYENQTTIPASATSKGENWYFSTLPCDSCEYGNLKMSPIITITNTKPSVSNLAITPSSPKSNDDLTTSYSYTDPDTDAEINTEILWYKEGILQGALNGSKTVPVSYTAKGEVWHCKVRPSDGTDFGDWVISSLNVTIGNTAPSTSNLSTIPSEPKIGDDLIISYNFNDPDTDPEKATIIRWYKNGIEQVTYENQTTIPASATSKGENWYFTIQPSDGIEYGSLELSPIVTISNTAPSVSDLNIDPWRPKTDDDLIGSYSYLDVDSDLESGSYVCWFKNDVEQIVYENQTTIPASATSKGENWYCTILPCDGSDYGYLKISPIITITNTKPFVSGLALSPNEPLTGQSLIASYIYTDVDADPESGTEIYWYKNGVLQGALNGSATVAASITAKGQEWHFKIRPSDGINFGDLISVSDNVTIVNTAPSANSLAIEPSDPKTTNDLTSIYIYSDPDSDPESGSIIRWYKNGIEQFGYENETIIPTSATNKGENWYFTLQPNDGTDYGSLNASSIITIGNTAPSVSNLIITPINPKTGYDLTTSYSYIDLDSDPESGSIIRWFKNGVEQFSLENQTTISAAATNKEENWYFSIQPYDGTDYGNLQSSSIITIMNTKPSISNLVIIPSNPISIDDISISYIYTDEDSDPESETIILWYRDGMFVGALEDIVIVPTSYIAKGQVWHCKVRPSDGTDFGEWVDSSINVTIGNTAPFASELAITPSEPKTEDDLYANYIYTDPDTDVESESIIRWYKNGIEKSVYENQTTIPSSATSKGENWYFTIQPSDGTDCGDLQTSPTVTIANTAPSVSDLAIIPSESKTGDTLITSYSFTDPDSDLESGTIIRWYKNGIEQPGYENQLNLPAAATNKGENWYFTILPSDGTDYGDLQTSPTVTITNTAPSVSDLAITPSEPKTGDTLTASYSFTDPDSDLESGSIIRWYKDGIEQPGYENQLNLPAAATNKGENWYFTILPSDGTDYGDLQTSPTVTIANTGPSASNLDMSPNSPQTTSDLFTIYTYSDPDSDPESSSIIRWYKNGIEQSVYENQTTILSSATSKGENWYFTIQPSDGSDYGILQTSPIVTITNTVPSASDLSIIPDDPLTNHELALNYTYTDPDNDPESDTKILWFKEGVLQGALNDSTTVPSSYTAKGQVWYCEVRPSDGTDFGEWVSSATNVTINNTAPTTNDLIITPANPKTGNDLLASYTYTDPDLDPESESIIHWYKNGDEQTVYENQTTIPASITTKGENWHFTILPSDGSDYGILQTSPIITIMNTAPSAHDLIISPSSPVTGDDLIATYGYSDVDTDPESGSFIRWYKNGLEQNVHENQTTIPSSATSKGENWYFTIEPSDGSDYGSQKTSPIITIINTAPSASNVVISPTSPQTGHTLLISYTYTDPDNDFEIGTEIVWYKDKILQGTLNGSTAVAASYTVKGQEWYCKIRPSDGTEFGNWASVQINATITNSAPSASDLTIIPSNPTSSEDLIASYYYADPDSDAESGTEIIWYKDNLLQGGLNGSTTVQASLTVKGQIWHFKVRPKDGLDFGEWIESPNKTIRNTPPTTSDVKILEKSPVNETLDLHATYVYSDYDGDPQVSASREIRWYRDSVFQSSLNDTLTVGAGNTTVGQIWYFTIQVSDGFDQSSLRISPSVGIQIPPNNPPEARFLNITPSNPTQANNLYINWTFHDVDGDEESGSQYQWYRNGYHMSQYDNLQILPSTATVKGDAWHIKVRPRDGKDFGNWASVPGNVSIRNTAPSANDLSITPSESKTGDELLVSYSYVDPDLDPEYGTEIIWYKNGELQGALNGSMTILSNYTSKGQEWHCKVRPSDGTDFGDWEESPINITIVNTVPSVSDITITPSEPETGHNLTANYTFIDEDIDPESGSIICWFKNGLEQPAYENQTTISAVNTNKGENWQFTIKPNDGTDFGSQSWSSIATIANTAPLVSSLEISPSDPLTEHILTASYTYTDADTDPESGTKILWYKNGVLQGAINDSTTVAANYTAKGEEWCFKVHPSDGIDFGEWISVSINMTVGNTAPFTSDLTIIPSEPQTGNDLMAYYNYTDVDTDPENGSIVCWFKNGVEQLALENQTVVAASSTSKGETWYFTIQSCDGNDYGSLKASSFVIIINTAPSANSLKITPNDPKTDHDLSVTYDFSDADSDLENGSYIRWYKNEEEQPTFENKTSIPAFAITKGETWYFTIEPSDGSDFGILKTSPSVTIANTAPSVSDLIITPSNPKTGDDLIANYNYSDADSDPETGTEIIWYKDGVLQEALNGSTVVSASYTTKGHVWHYKVHPSDGTDFGEWISVSMNMTINNTAPSAENLIITPSEPLSGNDLKAEYIYTDTDMDPESGTEIIWYKDGELQGVLNGSTTVFSTYTAKEQVWSFKVRPSDGTDFGEWVSVSMNITVVNTAPSVNNLAITPSSPKTGDDLIADYNYSDVDSDFESGSYRRWYKNGVEQLAYENLTIIPASISSKGETWYLTIQPSDGSDYGSLKTSPIITILNSAPSASGLTITPSAPQTGDDLVASYIYTDADTDPETGTEIIWYKDGVLQTVLNGSTTVATSYTTKGQVWCFKVHPSDTADFGEWVSVPINVTISNTAPSASDLATTPSSPKTGHDLEVNYIYTDTDADPENGTEIIWYKNGILQTALNGTVTVGAGNTTKGDKWYFKIHPFDGTDFGIWLSSPVNVTIDNTAPVANNLEITPSAPQTGDGLTAIYEWMDVDSSDSENDSRIRWYKNGILQTTLNDIITVDNENANKGEVWYFTIQPSDGTGYGSLKTSPSVIIANTAPSTSELVIMPSNPKTANYLQASYIFTDSDTDPESGSIIRWYKTGVEQFDYGNQTTIPASATSKGETWYFTIQPGDGTNWGNLQTSPIVTIMNTAPSASDLVIIPNTPMTGQSLIANYNYIDVDMDPESGTEIVWYKDGILQEILYDSLFVATSYTAKEQIWHCKIRPYDGSNFGNWIDSLYNVTIGNSAPSASNLIITPTSPKTGNDLTAFYNYSDPDDPENTTENGSEILWYKDGVLQGALNDFKTVPANYTARGQVWHYKVHPKDGVDFGSWFSLSYNVTILNTEPEVTSADIYPPYPPDTPSERPVYTNDTLTATFEGEDTDNDQIIARNIVWINNSIEVPSLENNTKILPEYTKKGQYWTFKVRVFDGFDWSDFISSSGRYIENSVPQVLNVNLNGGENTSDDVIVSYDFHDEDGDTDHSEIIWRIIHPSNSSSYFIEETTTLSSSKFVAGDIIWVIITPNDGPSTGQLLDKQKIVGNAIPQINTTLGLPEILTDHPEGTDKYFVSNLTLIYVNYSALVVDLDAEENLAFNVIEEENNDVIYTEVNKISGAEYRWYRYNFMLNSWELQENLTSSFIRGTDLNKDEQWIVSVRPKDIYDFGDWVNSSSITIANSYPEIVISNDEHPEFIVEDKNLTMEDNYYYWEDYDYDQDLSYIWWYRDGILQKEYNNTRIIPSTATLPGEKWKYVICPFDGTDFGENCTSPSIIIESKAVFNNYNIIPQNDTEGQYVIVLNITDSRNDIKRVEYYLFFNKTVHHQEQREIASNEIQNIYVLNHNLPDYSYLNTITIVKVEAITEVNYSDTIYTISSSLSFDFRVKDLAPPRVLNANFTTDDDLNPTNLTFSAKVEEFGSGIAQVVLYYYFESVNKTSNGGVGFGSSLNQKEYQWSRTSMIYYKDEDVYKVTIPFNPNRGNWNVIYTIKTVDNNGNTNDYNEDIKEDQFNSNNGELILNLDPALIITYALLIGLIGFISVIVLVVHRYRQETQAIQRGIEQKFDVMKSIRLIFCRTSFGVQFYNEQTFHDFNADIDVLSGLSAAISDFMKDVTAGLMAHSEEEAIDDQKTEFEALGRKGLNMLIWNGIYSSVAIISDKVLPKIFRVSIKRIGKEVEDDFAEVLGNYLSPNQIPTNEVKKIVRKHLPMYYCSPLTLNGGALRLNNNTLSKKEHQMWTMINQKVFSGSEGQYSFPEGIINELSSKFKRIEIIKFLKKAVKLNLLVEFSLPHSIDSSTQPFIAERIEE